MSTTSSTWSGFVRNKACCLFVGCSSSSQLKFVHSAPANPILGTYAEVSFSETSTSNALSGGSFSYVNGLYMFKSKSKLHYSEDFLTGWQEIDLGIDSSTYMGTGRPGYTNGKYFLMIDEKVILLGAELAKAAEWPRVTYTSLAVGSQTNGIDPIYRNDRVDFICGASMVSIPLYALPVSDPAPLYEYIKVKEGV